MFHICHSRIIGYQNPSQPVSNMDHPLRATLASELHARPFLRLSGSASMTHYAIYDGGEAGDSRHAGPRALP
jgi:hypothetical protein